MEHTRKLAVITGASSGIGYQISIQFAKAGFDLFIIAEDNGIVKAAQELSKFGVNVRNLQINLTTQGACEECYRQITSLNHPIAVAVLNAGIGINGKFWETNIYKEMKLIDLNINSTTHLAKLFTQDMIKWGVSGKILFTSSIAATIPGPYTAVYNASKAYIQSLAMALHYELKEKNISVTALMPDATDTNFFKRAEMLDTKIGMQEKDDPALVAKQGYDALMAGDAQILAGSLKNRLRNSVNNFIPEQMKAKIYASISEPHYINKEKEYYMSAKNDHNKNAKADEQRIPMKLSSVSPEDYPQNIDSANGSAMQIKQSDKIRSQSKNTDTFPGTPSVDTQEPVIRRRQFNKR